MYRNKGKYKDPKPMRFSKSCAKGKVRSNTCLPQETKEKSNKQPKFTPKATRIKRNEEPQGQQKERNLKNQGRDKCKRNKGDHSKNQQSQKLVL